AREIKSRKYERYD
ncbi:hypothetical protein TNCT_418601, partial [Trichonephila clavata]